MKTVLITCLGRRCQHHRPTEHWFRLCSSLKCRNNGVCLVTASGRRCVCDPPFSGSLCHLSPSSSSSSPSSSPLAAAAASASLKSGQQHQRHGSSCTPNPCRNGGICVLGRRTVCKTCLCNVNNNQDHD